MGNLRAQSKITCKIFAVLLVLLAVFSAQNALAVATAGSTAYYDWGTLNISGGGATFIGSTQGTYFTEGYTIPNQAQQDSEHTRANWDNDITRKRNNPAGPTVGYAIADTPISTFDASHTPGGAGWDTLIGDYTWTNIALNDTSLGQGLFAKSYAQVDADSFGDDIVDQYSSSSGVQRWGEFTAQSTGTYTITIEYNLKQAISVEDYQTDIADAVTTFQFMGGYVGAGGTWFQTDSDIFAKDLVYDPIYEDYNQSFAATGLLTLMLDVVAGQDYWLWATLANSARAGSDDNQNPQPGAVPEPGTIALVGMGLAGLAARYRRGKGGEEA